MRPKPEPPADDRLMVDSEIATDWLADGLLELGLGLGFLATGYAFWRFLLALSASGPVIALAGRFILGVTVISFTLPVLVVLAKRWLTWPRQPVARRVWPTWRSQLLGAVIGLPILALIAWLSVWLPRLPLTEIDRPVILMTALITSLIPLGFAIATAHGRFYAMTLIVAGSGLLFAAPDIRLVLASLAVWNFTGILFLLAGGAGAARFWRRAGRSARADRNHPVRPKGQELP